MSGLLKHKRKNEMHLIDDWWESATYKNLLKKQNKISECSNLIFDKEKAKEIYDIELSKLTAENCTNKNISKDNMLMNQLFIYRIKSMIGSDAQYDNKSYMNIYELLLLFKIKYDVDFNLFEFKESVKSEFINDFNSFMDEHG